MKTFKIKTYFINYNIMYLFVCLGNVGEEYDNTRHNVGFLIADKMIREYDLSYDTKKFHSEIFTGYINGAKIILIKPQTYMNKSGIAVSEVANFYKIPLENIYVFQDDMDLELGKMKFKTGGGSAGHNGIKSIDEMISKDYHRIRIVIGRPKYENDVVNFVLNKFTEDERVKLENICDRIVGKANLMLNNRDLFLTTVLKKS